MVRQERAREHALRHLLLHGRELRAPVPVLVPPALDEREQTRDQRWVRVVERGMRRDEEPVPERGGLVQDEACHLTRACRGRCLHGRRY